MQNEVIINCIDSFKEFMHIRVLLSSVVYRDFSPGRLHAEVTPVLVMVY